jgi:hypothetical protein
VKLPTISAGEFFELLRPTAFILSALLSIWVLANTRRRGFRLYVGLLWALGTFFVPFVMLPVYFIVLIFRQQHLRSNEPEVETPALSISHRFLPPAVYGVVLLGATSVYLYRDYNSVDAHLARATQAKLSSQPAKTIREYRAALALENDPHTHNLLGIELAEAGDWPDALVDFRAAQLGGEADESLPFKIAEALSATGDHGASVAEYQKFLDSQLCRQELPDSRCEVARKGLEEKTVR